ncbi:MAG: hypothetical protein DWQ06_14190 [Calditrichaeota bacterium]|nr:MAG: hypothetical protein DWQ06_14190 [Calditrichota bacterium]
MNHQNILLVLEGVHDLYFYYNYLFKIYGLEEIGRNEYCQRENKRIKNLTNSNFTFKFLLGNSKEGVLLENDLTREQYQKALNEFSKILIIFDPDEGNEIKFEEDKKQLTAKLEKLAPNHNKEIIFGDWKFDCPKFHGQNTIALENITTFLLRKIEPENYPEKEIEAFLKATNGKLILKEKVKINNKLEPNICKVLLSDKYLHEFYQEIIETTKLEFLKETVTDKFGVGEIFEFLNDENTQEK